MELPNYSKISPEELSELEQEFGGPLTEELALWIIRHRMNWKAVERMMEDDRRKARRAPGKPLLGRVA